MLASSFGSRNPIAQVFRVMGALQAGLQFVAGSLWLLVLRYAHCMVQTISAGYIHTCAMLQNGEVECWGYNQYGQLGYGTKGNYDHPGPTIDLGTGRFAVAIVCGSYHTCAILDNGGLKCWGWNLSGQLGLGDTKDRGDAPLEMGDSLHQVNVGSGRTVKAVTGGRYHTCALLDNNSVKCWGENESGQLGLGDTTDRGVIGNQMGNNLPSVDLGDDFTPTMLSVGESHSCALSAAGQIKCWGKNTLGQLGQGDNNDRGGAAGQMGNYLESIDLGANRTAVVVSAAADSTCALLDDGNVKCWGSNAAGQLGIGNRNNKGGQSTDMGDNLPSVDLGTGRTAVWIAIGESFTCAILDDASVKCWGSNIYGQLGQGDKVARGDNEGEMGNQLPPISLGTSRTVMALATGSTHAIAVLDNASVKCWGRNWFGQLGIGDNVDRGIAENQMGDDLPAVNLTGTLDTPCQLGYFGRGDCQPCPADTWGIATAASNTGCVACFSMFTSFVGATQCALCPAGKYLSEEDCINCPAGTFSVVAGALTRYDCSTHARLHVVQSTDDKLALRVDDNFDDTTYCFVDQEGRVRINSNVYDEADETFVVDGSTRLRGDVALEGQSSTVVLQSLLASKLTVTDSGLLIQSGLEVLTLADDACSSHMCKEISLPTPVTSGTEIIQLSVMSAAQDPSAVWINDVLVEEPNDAVQSFSIQAAFLLSNPVSDNVTVSWFVLGKPASSAG